MKFSKGLMIVALCAMSSFSVITPSSYFERAKAKAQNMYGQAKDTYNKYGSTAKDMYGQAQGYYGQAQGAYNKYAPAAQEMYGKAQGYYGQAQGMYDKYAPAAQEMYGKAQGMYGKYGN